MHKWAAAYTARAVMFGVTLRANGQTHRCRRGALVAGIAEGSVAQTGRIGAADLMTGQTPRHTGAVLGSEDRDSCNRRT